MYNQIKEKNKGIPGREQNNQRNRVWKGYGYAGNYEKSREAETEMYRIKHQKIRLENSCWGDRL